MTTILSIAERVSDEVGLGRPTSLVAGTDQLSRQMFALMLATQEELRDEHEWPQLIRDYTVSGAVNDVSLPLPADFLRMIADTGYEADTYNKLIGSMTPAQWAAYTYTNPVNTGRVRFKLQYYSPTDAVQRIYVSPAITSVTQSFVFQYITNKNVLAVNGVTLKTAFTMDDDSTLLPENLLRMGLKWRIKQAKGLDYSEDYNKYEDARRTQFAKALDLGTTPVAVRGTYDLPTPYCPNTGFGV